MRQILRYLMHMGNITVTIDELLGTYNKCFNTNIQKNTRAKHDTGSATVTGYHCPIEKCVYSKNQGRYFEKKSNVKQHYERCHAERSIPCPRPQCAAMFASDSLLRRHLNMSCGQSYACSSCDKCYSTREALYSHARRTAHTLAAFTCQQCEQRFCCAEELTRHAHSTQHVATPVPMRNRFPKHFPPVTESSGSTVSLPRSGVTSVPVIDMHDYCLSTAATAGVDAEPATLATVPVTASETTDQQRVLSAGGTKKRRIVRPQNSMCVQVDTLGTAACSTMESESQTPALPDNPRAGSSPDCVGERVEWLDLAGPGRRTSQYVQVDLGRSICTQTQCDRASDGVTTDMVAVTGLADVDDDDVLDIDTAASIRVESDVSLATLNTQDRPGSSIGMWMSCGPATGLLPQQHGRRRDNLPLFCDTDEEEDTDVDLIERSDMETQTSVLDLFDFHDMPRLANMETQTMPDLDPLLPPSPLQPAAAGGRVSDMQTQTLQPAASDCTSREVQTTDLT